MGLSHTDSQLLHGFSSFCIFHGEEIYLHGLKNTQFFVINILSSLPLAWHKGLIHSLKCEPSNSLLCDSWRTIHECVNQPRQHIKKQRHYFADKGLVKTMVFPVVMYGCESWARKKLSTKKLMLLNCGVREDSWEALGLQGDPTSPFWRRSALGFLWKKWC